MGSLTAIFKYLCCGLLLWYSQAHAQLSAITAEKKAKVIVVGGGISGLAAAQLLNSKDIEVLVLEAQNKLGGRLRTDREDGVVFDEGASWIHGPEDNPISALADSAGITTFLTQDTSVVVYNTKGKVYSKSFLDLEEEQYVNVLEEIGGRKHSSVYDYMKQEYPEKMDRDLWTYMFSAFLEFDTGGDISKLSAKYFYDDKAFNGEDVIVTNGYDKIIHYLSKDLTVELNTFVNQIDYSKDGVVVKTNSKTYKADYVLVTVPLGILKNKSILFTPPLKPKTTKAIDFLEMGTVNKFLCVWDTVFWDAEQYIGFTPKEKGKFNYFLNVNKFANKFALMTFAFGEYAKETELLSDSEVTEEIMNHLRVIYGDSIPYPLLVKRTYWNTNPFTLGAYSFVGVGGKSKYYKGFKQKKRTRLYFAGEHTNRMYRGTVHGAYLSGLREAKRILKSIK